MAQRKFPKGTEKEHQIKRQNEFIAEKYDRFTLTFPKGMKEKYKERTTDKLESIVDNIDLISSVLNVLK